MSQPCASVYTPFRYKEHEPPLPVDHTGIYVLGPVSISDKASYHKMSNSVEQGNTRHAIHIFIKLKTK